MRGAFSTDSPLLAQLVGRGMELDQKLKEALSISASRPDLKPEDVGFPDSYLTLALYRCNTILTRLVQLNETRLNIFHDYKKAPACAPEDVRPGRRLCQVMNRAVDFAGDSKVLGVGHYLRAVVDVSQSRESSYPTGRADKIWALHGTFSAETLLWGLGYNAWTSLAKAPEVERIMGALLQREPIEDYQYMLAMDKDKIVFRPASILDPYNMQTPSGEVASRLALLTQFKTTHGAFLPTEIMELEDLINNPLARESEFQRFFENHPQFFRMWEFRDVYSQVYLSREEDGPLVPDFVLIDPDLQKAMILDLKLPTKKVTVLKQNRQRFSAAVAEAKAQLQEYRDWFDDKARRQSLKERFGLEVYRPSLGVVIGRSADFPNEFTRQQLSERESDVSVVTYDDILAVAKRRILLMDSSRRR